MLRLYYVQQRSRTLVLSVLFNIQSLPGVNKKITSSNVLTKKNVGECLQVIETCEGERHCEL